MKFKRYIFIITVLIGISMHSLYADPYTLKKNSHTVPRYFIKVGACIDPDHARKIMLSTDFPSQIIYIKKYYSIVSQEFTQSEYAKKMLQKIRKKYKNAYLITLYRQDTNQPVRAITKTKKVLSQPSLLHIGIAQYNDQAYEEALATFDRILIETPENTTAKRYYAKTLYQLKLFKEAKKIFTQLLAAPLQKSEKKEIKSYLKKIEAKRKKQFYNASVTIGFGYDDNINLNTDEESTQYGPYTLLNDTNKTRSTYGIATLSLSHKYSAESFTIYSSLYSYNEIFHTAKGNDLNYLDTSVALIKKFQKMSLILPVGANIIFLDSTTLSYNFYSKPSLLYQLSQNIRLSFYANYTNNKTKFASHRDYDILGGGIGLRYRHKQWLCGALFKLDKYDAKQNIRYDINKNLTGYTAYAKYQLFIDLYLSANLSYETQHFRDLDPVMGYRRRDEKKSYTLSLNKITEKNSLLTATYKNTNNSANINVFSYRKNNYALTYKHQF